MTTETREIPIWKKTINNCIVKSGVVKATTTHGKIWVTPYVEGAYLTADEGCTHWFNVNDQFWLCVELDEQTANEMFPSHKALERLLK